MSPRRSTPCPLGEPCLPVLVRGDGVVGSIEICDDDPVTSGDGCDDPCQIESECAVAGDCRLRCGTGCRSSCGGGEDVIAVRADADLRVEFCGDEDVACVACACSLPESVGVDSLARRCEVTNLRACTPGDELSCNEDPGCSGAPEPVARAASAPANPVASRIRALVAATDRRREGERRLRILPFDRPKSK